MRRGEDERKKRKRKVKKVIASQLTLSWRLVAHICAKTLCYSFETSFRFE